MPRSGPPGVEQSATARLRLGPVSRAKQRREHNEPMSTERRGPGNRASVEVHSDHKRKAARLPSRTRRRPQRSEIEPVRSRQPKKTPTAAARTIQMIMVLPRQDAVA